MFEFNEQHRMIEKMVRQFGEKELSPHVPALEEGMVPYDIMRKFAKTFGLPGMIDSVWAKRKKKLEAAERGEAKEEGKGKAGMIGELGGLGGGDPVMAAIIGKELCRISPGFMLSLSATVGLYGGTVMKKGTSDQQEKWGIPVLKFEKIGAWAMTEPGAGSDAYGGMKTVAKRDGDGYRISGEKTFITNAPYADYFSVYAKLDTGDNTPLRERPIQCFVIERGTPGLETSKPFKKMGMHASPTGAVYLDNVFVPAGNMLGKKEKEASKEQSRDVFSGERSGAPIMALGIIERCIDDSIKYMKTREQFGKPIAEFQGLQFKLAQMFVIRENVRNLMFKQLWAQKEGKVDMAEACAAKVYCGQAAVNVALDAIQIHGGMGYMAETGIEMLMRDAKLMQIGGGTDEIQYNTIARELLRRGRLE
ncbi:MAG: acyl-CoA dehydrogenase family protein [Bdellovibrionota bacterium]